MRRKVDYFPTSATTLSEWQIKSIIDTKLTERSTIQCSELHNNYKDILLI